MNEDLKQERIQKLISNYGKHSRRELEKLIVERRVTINGNVAVLGEKATIKDNVFVDGKKVNFNLKQDYFLLNKPKGYICSRIDKKGKQAISLINNHQEKNLFTVGRLDVLTTGLIIVTNDGYLGNYILKPKNNIKKTYLVWFEKKLYKNDIYDLKNGLELDDGYFTKPLLKIKIIHNDDEKRMAKISLKEGKKNQIRRMFEALDNRVINLKRISIGDVELGDIQVGEYKRINKSKIYNLLNII